MKIYSRVLGFANQKHGRAKPKSVPKKKDTLRVLRAKSTFVGRIGRAFPALGLVRDGRQAPGGLDTRMFSALWGVTGGPPGGLAYIQASTQDRKVPV